MTKVILIGLLIMSTAAFAKTYSQKTADQMIKVLQSKEVQALLSQVDGVGNIKGIRYLFSGRAAFGPDKYELSFDSFGPAGSQVCTVIVDVDNRNDEVRTLDPATCR